jgi:multisubunit Na+/H+ antiporter MnhC subunit
MRRVNREGQLLVNTGVILLAISLVNGFFVHALPLVRLALSAHLVGLLGSTFLIGLGAGWAALALTRRASRVAALLAVYGFGGGWFVYFAAAATGSGGMFPIASGNTRGDPILEAVLTAMLLTVALALFALCGVILRTRNSRDSLHRIERMR